MKAHQQQHVWMRARTRRPGSEAIGVFEASWVQQGADLLDIAAASMSGDGAAAATATASLLWQMPIQTLRGVELVVADLVTIRAAAGRLRAAAGLLRADAHLGTEFVVEADAWTDAAVRWLDGPRRLKGCA